MPSDRPLPQPRTVLSLIAGVSELARREGLLLSGVAGAVDGIGYVVLHVFTAHITGNTVHVGTAAGRLDFGSAWHPALAIAAFVAGVVVGALVREACGRRPGAARPVVLGIAGALLVAFLAVGLAAEGAPTDGGHFAVLAGLAALAMGCQNAIMPKIGGRRVRTYITGTMTELGEALVAAARDRGERAASLARAADLFAVWLTYLVGAVVSGAVGTRWGVGAALVPLAGIAVVVAIDLRRWRTEAGVGSRITA